MNKTLIGTVKNPGGTQGYTWNPITGCLNHVNGMCKGGNFPCYAYRQAHGRLKQRYLDNLNIAPYESEVGWEYADDPFYPRFWPERLQELPVLKTYQGRFSSEVKNALLAKQCKGIFVCDMSDLFGIGIPEDWTRAVLGQCNKFWHHRFYLLTKQPQNLVKFSPFPDNCWVGVTATDSHTFSKAMFWLRQIEAKVKYLSLEPLRERILPSYIGGIEGINWLIIGAQTKPYKPPKIEWVQEIVEAADKAGIPVFLKNNLDNLLNPNDAIECYSMHDGGAYRLRQELPVVR